MTLEKVPSTIKDERLIAIRREQMIKAAVILFKEKGFHRTTTRELAKTAGFSIGTLYEYIRKKEDILFLVCDSIYERVKERMDQIIDLKEESQENLTCAIRAYFTLMDEMQDEVLVMYQEVKALPKEAQDYVLKKEKEMVHMLQIVIQNSLDEEKTEDEVFLIANNIFVQGQMWGFRRWALQKKYDLDTYCELQIRNLIHGIL
ncbi:TetR/AcrR family transcriptional regulator [Bacillaceae bacterium S4-13-58]